MLEGYKTFTNVKLEECSLSNCPFSWYKLLFILVFEKCDGNVEVCGF